MLKFSAIPNTDWNLIEAAGATGSTAQNQAMQTLLVQYLPALQAHVISKWRVPIERAEDLVQEFIVDKVVASNLVGQANQKKGRFRNFIRRTLDAFVVSQWRSDHAKKRAPDKLSSLDSAESTVDSESDPHEAFAIAWAREVIAAAVDAMERECQTSCRLDLWGLFQARILAPALDGSTPVAYEDLVLQFDFLSPLQAANALTTAKRMFERNLRSVLRRYTMSESEVDNEIRDLQTILSGGHA